MDDLEVDAEEDGTWPPSFFIAKIRFAQVTINLIWSSGEFVSPGFPSTQGSRVL
jgi:hypothetical protein